MSVRGLKALILTVDYRETIFNRIQRDPDFAAALLDEAAEMILNGEAEPAKLLIRDLTRGLLGVDGRVEARTIP